MACHGDRHSADLEGVVCEPHYRATKQTNYKLENNYTKEILIAKVLGPITDFPTWGFGKGTENPQGI